LNVWDEKRVCEKMKTAYLLEMKGIKKHFGGIQALDGVNFQVKKGEVHALIGENGAGKSTLMKILGGAYTLDEGDIYINGQHIKISNPIEAQKFGIAVIYQEQALVDSLTVADNILLGRIPNNKGIINNKRLMDLAVSAMQHVGASFDPSLEIRELTVAQRQFVEIAKAISMDARIIVMDEPTAVLTLSETEILFKLIRELKKQGCSIIYISHRLEELYCIADTCTVLKDGKYVGTRNIKEVDNELLIRMMTGREILNIYPPPKAEAIGPERLSVSGMTRKKVFEDISFRVHEKEVIGMAGLVGSGRTEVARAIFGVDQIDSGEISIDGEKMNIKNPAAALEKGIVYITEDRKGNGVFLDMPVCDNITISTVKKWSKYGVIQRSKEENAVMELVKKLSVKCSGTQQMVGELSGGNQQKVMIARGLLSNAKIVIIDEPTRGVDVGTKAEIYKIIRSIANEGKAVIMISSELPEIIGMSDRILVMHNGRITGILDGADVTEERILSFATGGIKSA